MIAAENPQITFIVQAPGSTAELIASRLSPLAFPGCLGLPVTLLGMGHSLQEQPANPSLSIFAS